MHVVYYQTNHNDDVIFQQYVQFDTPADQIVSDPDFLERFCEAANASLPSDSHVTLPPLEA